MPQADDRPSPCNVKLITAAYGVDATQLKLQGGTINPLHLFGRQDQHIRMLKQQFLTTESRIEHLAKTIKPI